jgi:hypothetical protein
MIKLDVLALVLLSIIAAQSKADEEEQQQINHSAIPPVISPDDPDMQKTAQDHIRILNAKKADIVIKRISTTERQIPSNSEQRLKERIYREKFDRNPRQTIPLKECIKPNGVIDNDVNECMNGRIKKTW